MAGVTDASTKWRVLGVGGLQTYPRGSQASPHKHLNYR